MMPSSSKKDSKDRDKRKRSRYHSIGDSSKRSHRTLKSEQDEYARSSSPKHGTLLNSTFSRDDAVAIAPQNSRSYPSNFPSPSRQENLQKPSTSHSHQQLSKLAHQDRPLDSVNTKDEHHHKLSRHEEPQPKISFKTAFTDPTDIKMAERQTRIKTLKLDELEKQHKWAQEKLQTHGMCPAGYKWWEYNKGVDEAGNILEGYRCWAGNHLVTHELLAEAKGGCYLKHRPDYFASLLVAGRVSRRNSGHSGSQTMPQYQLFNPMMLGYGGGTQPGFRGPPRLRNFSYNPGTSQQAASQRSPPQASINPAPRGDRIWFGPDYTSANGRGATAQQAAPVPLQLQNQPPHWVLRGD